jgi:hypothetical protein
VIGWGSNPLGSFSITPSGDQYTFKVVDFLSGKALTDGEVNQGTATAALDKNGQAVLTLNNPDANSFTVSIIADGYRDTKTDVAVGSKQATVVQMVPNGKEVYISKQSGKYDVYTSDLDGANKKVILPGTGSENDQLSLLVNPDNEEAALVSSRDNVRNSDGYLMQTLTMFNTSTGAVITVDHSESVQLVDWFGTKLVYYKVKAGASAANPARYQLESYDYKNSARVELAHANYFNSVIAMKGVIYYAASNNYAGGVSQFDKINPDNTGKAVVMNTDIWNAARSDYDTLVLQTPDGWYTYKPPAAQATKAASPPTNTNRLFVDGNNGKSSLWIDKRDGKGVLLVRDIAGQKDTTLATQSGINYPLRWLNDNTVIYRVSTPTESADYVVSTNGGAAKKINDVTNAAANYNWYY